MKKIIACVLALALMLTVLCVPASAIADYKQYPEGMVTAELYLNGKTFSAHTFVTNNNGYWVFAGICYYYKVNGGNVQRSSITSDDNYSGGVTHTRTAASNHTLVQGVSSHTASRFSYTRDLYYYL